MVHNSILTLIGNTPMVKINKLVNENDARTYAKLEEYNIGGSIKDRMSLYLIEDAERKGILSKDKTIIEASSGNTGIAMAMIASVKGYKIEIVIPESVSIERRKLIKAYGAKLILSPAEKGTGGAVEMRNRIISENVGKYVNLDQFSNPANIKAHYETTANEILKQTKKRVDMIIVGIGTAGTAMGISKRLKKVIPDIKVIGVFPELGSSIQGLRHPKELNPTKLFNYKYLDEIIEIRKDQIPETYGVARDLARKEGILVGMSSGATMYVAIKKAKELGKGKVIVVILPDTGERYLSTALFE